MGVVVIVFVLMMVIGFFGGSKRETGVTMRTVVVVLVRPEPVSVFERTVHAITI